LGQKLEDFAERSGTVVTAVAFVFWGIVQIWAMAVAIFGGNYPWPVGLILGSSSGGDWLMAVILFAVGGILVMGTVLIWNLVVILPLSAIARSRVGSRSD